MRGIQMDVIKLENMLRSAGHLENQQPMAQYMRNQFPFLGIKTPERREILKAFLKGEGDFSLSDAEYLYGLPEREFKYAAIHLLTKFQKKWSHKDLERLLAMALTEPWWDTIDSFAPGIFGPMALREKSVKEKMRELIYEENLWKKRIAILFQLKYKDKTDPLFLTEAIRENLHTREFFVDKAIGWSLREYAKTDEAFVLTFLQQEELSPLSRREGGKHLKEKILW